ncbi:hypothetical protein BGZ60DRAFT_62011 [Tricladium varicosporioides]|nr:hypothetical protein BGZ60DRAFT_62011 [Hymenoscyphus varicosporioides]
MATLLPETPGRGRSRFSKALPTAPRGNSPESIAKSIHSPLPPRPKDAMAAPINIPRRPVGAPKVEHTKAPSIASVSSVYSDSPGFLSRSSSESSSRDTRESLSGVDSEAGPAPALPPKDSQRQQPANPQTPNKTTLASTSSGFNYSPPTTELWKRRSVRSEKSIKFPELKLERSNGSTASPPQRKEPPTERNLPSIPFQLPRSSAGRKPVPARPAPPQPQVESMGSKLSKLVEKHSRTKSHDSNTGSLSMNGNGTAAPTPATNSTLKRLPTPEYLKTDKRQLEQPATPQVLSPNSPHTPPEEATPAVPRKSESRMTAATNITNETGTTNSVSSNGTTGTTIQVIPQVSTRPNLLETSSHSRDSSETLTITSEPIQMRSPQPKKSFTTSKILTPQPSPSPTSATSKKSPLPLGTPTKIHFPVQPSLLPPGSVYPGMRITDVQLDCYQQHRFMRGGKNAVCSTGCMVCGGLDKEMRWRCSWCCLSACRGCMQILASIPGKDLRACLEKVGQGGQNALGSGKKINVGS